jgi:hypothetical protein
LALLLGAISLFLAYQGQVFLSSWEGLQSGLFYWGGAIALFAFTQVPPLSRKAKSQALEIHPLSESRPLHEPKWFRLIVALAISITCGFTWASAGVNDFSLAGTVLWAVSIAMGCWFYFGLRSTRESLSGFAKVDAIFAVNLTLIAGLLRIWNLGVSPRLFGGDEAWTANVSLSYLGEEWGNVFGLAIGGSVPRAFSLLQGILINILGPTVFAARLFPALEGTITIAVFYYLVRLVFADRGLAIGASMFLAASYFHIHFSKMGIPNISSGLTTSLLYLLLLLGHLRSSPLFFFLAGVSLGVSQYLSLICRANLVHLAIFCLIYLYINRKNLKGASVLLGSALLGFLIAFVPMFIFWLLNPIEYNGRIRQVSIFSNNWIFDEAINTGRSVWQILWEDQISKVFLSFNHYHSHAIHLNSHKPYLLFWSSIFFIFGIVASLINFRRPYAWLGLTWFFTDLTLGGVLTIDSPQGNRIIGTIGGASILIACGVYHTCKLMTFNWSKQIISLLSSLVLFAISFAEIRFYFDEYLPQNYFGGHATAIAQIIGERFHKQEDGGKSVVYFPRNSGLWFKSHPNLNYLAPELTGKDLDADFSTYDLKSLPVPGMDTFVVLLQRENSVGQALMAAFPNLELTTYYGVIEGQNIEIFSLAKLSARDQLK